MEDKLKILVVEADHDDGELIRLALEDEPYEIKATHNGKDGVENVLIPSGLALSQRISVQDAQNIDDMSPI
jgi:CheY-like chemotaxis protein